MMDGGVEVYEIGQLVRLTARFTNAADRSIDPTTVNLDVTNPAGAKTTYSYPDDAEVHKDSIGNYHFDQSATAHGKWIFKWYSTGTGQAACHGYFIVEPDE